MSRFGIKDFYLEVARGNIPGMSHVNKFGSSLEIDEDAQWEIWDGGRAYVWPTSDSITHIRSAVDSAITQGVELHIQGLDDDYAFVEQTQTTNGGDSTTEVELDTYLRRVFRVKVQDDTPMDEDIWVGPDPASAANSSAIVQAGKNQTLMAIYTVPVGKTAYIVNYYADYVRNTVRNPDGIEIGLWNRDNTNDYAPQIKHQQGIPQQTSGIRHVFSPYMKVLEKTDIFLTAQPDGNPVHAHGGFDLILVDN